MFVRKRKTPYIGVFLMGKKEAKIIKKYEIIYADPPWSYKNRGRGSANKHYPTMTLDDICALPVQNIAAKNSALFMWVTFPQLPEAFCVMHKWGYIYKTVAFVWIKQNKIAKSWFYGMGYWTRSNAEICLLGIKGHPQRQSKCVHQLIVSPVEEHSKKTEIVRHKIIQLMGNLPRIELFARQQIDGWDVWGNEVCNSVML